LLGNLHEQFLGEHGGGDTPALTRLAIFAKRLEVGTFKFPDVRFVNGEYAPVEIERRQFAMLLEGIDTGSVKRLKRYHRDSRNQGEKAPQKGAQEVEPKEKREPVLLS